MPETEVALSILLVNQSWFAPELRAIGHNVVSAGWVHEAFDICFSRGQHVQDILDQASKENPITHLVYYDDSTTPSLLGLDALEIPSLFYSVDAHHHASWHSAFSAMFSKTLVAQKDYVREFANYSKDAEWFPLWAPREVAPEELKDIDVCFRGNLDRELHPKRADFFDELGQLISIDTKREPYFKSYPRAKIVVNQVVDGDLNFRVFEAMYSGALLITPRVKNGMSDLFNSGVDLLEYEEGDVEEVARLVRHYLSHDEERSRIADAGQKKAFELHSAKARASQLIEHLRGLKTGAQPKRHIGAASSYLYGCINGMLSRDDYLSVPANETEKEYLIQSVESLKKGIGSGEPFGSEGEVCILNIILICKKIGQLELGLDLLVIAIASHADNVLLRLMEIEALTKVGRSEDARVRALEISAKPDDVLDYAIESVAKAHEDVWLTMQNGRAT